MLKFTSSMEKWRSSKLWQRSYNNAQGVPPKIPSSLSFRSLKTTSISIQNILRVRSQQLLEHLPSVLEFLKDIKSTRGKKYFGKATVGTQRYLTRDLASFANEEAPHQSEEQKRQLRYVIMPRSQWKIRWDIWIGFIIMYSVIMIPYRIGFAIDLSKWEQLMNMAFDFCFGIDIVLNFFTGYYDEDSFISDFRSIRLRYIKSWLIFDVVSTIPFDQFVEVVTSASDASLLSLKLLRTIRLFRLLKLARLLRLKRTVEAIQLDALNAHVIQTLRTLIIIVFIIHLVACGWYMFFTWDPEGVNWVTQINKNGLKNPYMVSFYWVANTMMSVGYGDVHGVTDGERLYSIFVEGIGSISVGLIIANIQMLTENYNPRAALLKQKLHETKEFLISRSIPRSLRQRILSQFEYHWSRRSTHDEIALLSQFPKSFQYEILAASSEHLLTAFPFLGMMSVDFFVYIIPRLRPIVLGSGQLLVEAESVWEEVYFVVYGKVDLTHGALIVGSLSTGDICGIEYLQKDKKRHTRTYTGSSKSELYALYSNELYVAMEKCVLARTYLYNLALIVDEKYSDANLRGRKALQRQDTVRKIVPQSSHSPFLAPASTNSSRSSVLVLDAGYYSLQKIQHSLGRPNNSWTSRFIIPHYSRLRIGWDLIMGIMVIATAIAVPFRISFDIPDSVLISASDRLSDILFILDIILNFFTTYIDDTGVEITELNDIRQNYLKSSFFVDVISTIPFDFLVEVFQPQENFRSLRLIRTVKLVKLLRLMRLLRLFKVNLAWTQELDVNMNTLRLLKLLAPVMMIAHYVGCFWYYISSDTPESDAWWGRAYFDDRTSILSKYIASVYWATTTMTTVGFGDIYPVNTQEQVYSTIVMIGGTTLFAYVVGTVIEVVSRSKSIVNLDHEINQQFTEYTKERGLAKSFVNECREHLRFMNNEKTLFNETPLLESLCAALRGELAMYLNVGVITKSRFFDKKPKWFLSFILPRLTLEFFLPGNLLIYQGNNVSGIFFIVSGVAAAQLPRNRFPTSTIVEAMSSINSSPPVSDAECEIDESLLDEARPVNTDKSTAEAMCSNKNSDSNNERIIAKMVKGEFLGYREILMSVLPAYNVVAVKATGTYVLPHGFISDLQKNNQRLWEEVKSFIYQSILRQQTQIHHWQANKWMGLYIHETTRRQSTMKSTSAKRRCSVPSHHENNTNVSRSRNITEGQSNNHVGKSYLQSESNSDGISPADSPQFSKKNTYNQHKASLLSRHYPVSQVHPICDERSGLFIGSNGSFGASSASSNDDSESVVELNLPGNGQVRTKKEGDDNESTQCEKLHIEDLTIDKSDQRHLRFGILGHTIVRTLSLARRHSSGANSLDVISASYSDQHGQSQMPQKSRRKSVGNARVPSAAVALYHRSSCGELDTNRSTVTTPVLSRSRRSIGSQYKYPEREADINNMVDCLLLREGYDCPRRPSFERQTSDISIQQDHPTNQSAKVQLQ